MTEAELVQFVAQLRIPEDRKEVVLAELRDHVASEAEAAAREGRPPSASPLGDLGLLRRSLEAVEPAFRIPRWHAVLRGAVAGLLVAVLVERFGFVLYGTLAAIAAIACVVACAPPRALALLRAELRAPAIAGALPIRALHSVPVGPAIVYGLVVMSAPFGLWIALIVARALRGDLALDVPWSAFAVQIAVFLVLLVEGMRARRTPQVV